MKLSDSEKLILVMLCDLHTSLKIKSDIDPKFVESAIFSGNTWGLKWEYPGIFSDDEGDTPAVVSEVVNILDMWSFIEEAYKKLSQADKTKVESEAAPFGKHVQFIGFDGNNETEQYGIARFLIDDLKRFSIFKGRDLNSHSPSIEAYRRMYAVFEPMRASLADSGLSTAQIIELLKAKLHPSHR